MRLSQWIEFFAKGGETAHHVILGVRDVKGKALVDRNTPGIGIPTGWPGVSPEVNRLPTLQVDQEDPPTPISVGKTEEIPGDSDATVHGENR